LHAQNSISATQPIEGFAKTMNRETIAKHKHVCRLRLTCASP
jgi:hypothetical protein